MGKSTSPPPVPDPVATAQAQGQANTSTAASQAALNHVDQYTPYGSSVFNQTGSYTNDAGQTVPTYGETTSLSPALEQTLTGQEGITNSLLPDIQKQVDQSAGAISTPLNFNTADSATLNAAPQQLDQQAANAVYNEQAGFLNPQWQQQQQQTEDQLARQGIPVGSTAYDSAMTQLDNSRTQAYQSAADSATAQGSASASNLFNMALSGQQQNISQQTLAQQQPISLLQSLLGTQPYGQGQSAAPSTPSSVSPTDILGAQQLSSNVAQNNYGSQVATNNANTGAGAGIASALLLATLL